MVRRIIIRNKSGRELSLMLEPWTDQSTVGSGTEAIVEGDFTGEEEITIDVYEDNFLSIWSPPASKISCQ
jgi:hypothetical protein